MLSTVSRVKSLVVDECLSVCSAFSAKLVPLCCVRVWGWMCSMLCVDDKLLLFLICWLPFSSFLMPDITRTKCHGVLAVHVLEIYMYMI